jgi:hypothetical protein
MRYSLRLITLTLFCLTCFLSSTGADAAPPVHSQPSCPYKLEIHPENQEVQQDERFSIDIMVRDATNNLQMKSISFQLKIEPAKVFIPLATNAEAGDFLPDAFVVRSTPSRDGVASATYSVSSLTSAGSEKEEGKLVTLYLDAAEPGLAELEIRHVVAKDVYNQVIAPPWVGNAFVTVIGDATETPTPSPTPTATPYLTPTPAFHLQITDLEDHYFTVNTVQEVLVLVKDASADLNLAEIGLELLIESQPEGALTWDWASSEPGEFIPDSHFVSTEWFPTQEEPTLAKIRIGSLQNQGSHSDEGVLARMGAYVQSAVGYADIKILSASPVIDASGVLLTEPVLPPETFQVRLYPQLTGFPWENLYNRPEMESLEKSGEQQQPRFSLDQEQQPDQSGPARNDERGKRGKPSSTNLK